MHNTAATPLGKRAEVHFDFIANPMAIYRQKDGSHVYVNKAFHQVLGYLPEEVIGRTVAEVGMMEPGERRALTSRLRFAGAVRGQQIRLKTAAGEAVDADVYLDQVTYKNKKCVLATYVDITQTKRLEREVVRFGRAGLAEEYSALAQAFGQFVEKAPFGFLMCDKNGIILYCNRAYRQYFSPVLQGDPTGRHVSTLQAAIGEDYGEMHIVKALAGREYNNQRVSLYGSQWVLNAFPLVNACGEIFAATLLIQDVTEEERLQEEIRRLDRLNLIGQMAAGVAHEIRNPMTVVKGYLQYLQGKVPEELQRQFAIATKELNTIESIIADFLSLARCNSSEKHPGYLNEVIAHVAPLIVADAVKSKVAVEVAMDHTLPCQMINAKEIKQVLLNLTRNAIDAMPDGGLLTITTAAEKRHSVLTVADTGYGIARERLERIFSPFYTTKAEGNGLGLPICKKIIDDHGGRIDVDSRRDQGTTFKIRLPLPD